MATKRLTDTGIANLNATAAGRLEIWHAIIPGFGLRVGARRKTFVVMARAEGRLRRVSLGVFPGMSVAERTGGCTTIDARHLPAWRG